MGLTTYGLTMLYGPVIAANLTAGDKIYINQYAPTINSTLIAFYAGLHREINSFSLKQDNVGYHQLFIEFHWDRISGMLCKETINVTSIDAINGYKTNIFYQLVMNETNIWPPERIAIFNVAWNGEKYPVIITTNSIITSFAFNQSLKQICFNVSGQDGSKGFCNITISTALLGGTLQSPR